MSAGAIRRTDDSDHRLSIFWFRLWTKLVGRRGEIGATQPSQPKGPGGKHQHPTEHYTARIPKASAKTPPAAMPRRRDPCHTTS